MRFSIAFIATSAAALLVSAAPASKNKDTDNAGGVTIQKAHGHRVKGSYIITLKASADRDVQITSAEQDGGVRCTHKKWNSKVFNGFAGTFSDQAIQKMRKDPAVLAIEEDVMVHTFQANTTQKDASWGLQRISQNSKTSNQNPSALTFSYKFDQRAGSGVDVYIIDTGINTAHVEFGGRAVWGATFGGYPDRDGNGHGTHVAGTAISSRYGVAKKARAYAVKVLADDGSGMLSDVISGVTWSVSQAQSSGRPSIINLSLGGGASAALDQAVNSAASRGVHVAVAAGNENVDASNSSPARATGVVTVGATTIADARASFSNFGAPLDIWAPGQSIISTWIGSTTAIATLSGTSMATPHIAGLMAYYISVKGNSSPASLRSKLQAQALSGVIRGLPAGTKNALANNGYQDSQ